MVTNEVVNNSEILDFPFNLLQRAEELLESKTSLDVTALAEFLTRLHKTRKTLAELENDLKQKNL